MTDKLILLVQNQINEYSSKIARYQSATITPLENLKNNINKIIGNPLLISKINLTEFNNSLTVVSPKVENIIGKKVPLDEMTLVKLKFYQIAASNSSFPLTEENKIEIATIFKKLNDSVEQLIGYERNTVTTYTQRKITLELLKEKINTLNNGGYLKDEELDLIANLLIKSNRRDKLKTMSEIVITSYRNLCEIKEKTKVKDLVN